jgi:hypothetical protein
MPKKASYEDVYVGLFFRIKARQLKNKMLSPVDPDPNPRKLVMLWREGHNPQT